MKILKAAYDWAEFVVEYHFDRVGIEARDETGAVSTETAVLAAALVAIAAAGGGILMGKMRSNANQIQDQVPLPAP